MRKIFTIFAAMLIALTASAANVWYITPTHCHEGDRADGYTLYVEVARGAQAGDTIVLADGEYSEGQSIPVNVPIVIKAAAGARPVVKMSGYFQVHASLKVEGIKFQFVGAEGNGYCFYFYENTSKYLALENCEFQNFTQYVASSWEKYHIDSCIVNDCYFHDLAKAPFYFAKSTLTNDTNACDYLAVKNSTFANITLHDVAVLDLRNNNNSTAATSKLRVDHCTFYNCKGYERMIQTYKSPDGKVTNCIMMNPLDADTVSPIYATYLYGSTAVVDHNLNFQTKKQYISGGTVTNKIEADPLFVDAAHGNFMLAAGSPALGAATDGSNLGDPHWNSRTLYLKPGGWTADGAKFAIWCFGSGSHSAQWSPFMTQIEETGIYSATIPAGYPKVIFARLNNTAEAPDWNDKWNQTGNLDIPAQWNLFTITGGEGDAYTGTWSLKDAKYYIVGSMTDWDDAKKIGCLEDSYTIEGLDAGIHQFKIVDAETGAWYGLADLQEFAAGGLFLYPDGYGNICFKLETAGNATITYKKNTELAVEGNLVVPTMAIVGTLVGGWDPEDITPMEAALDMKTATYTVENLAVQDGYEFKLIFDGMWITREGDESTYYTIHSGWKKVDGLGMDSEGKKSIKLNASEAGNYIFTWDYATGTMNVSFPSDATAIDNTNAELKAVKRIENGQLIIEKAGKKYNAIGVEIK